MPGRLLLFLLFITCLFLGCKEVNTDNPRLARVHNHALYLSDLDGLMSENTSPEDSAVIIQTFRNRWIRETLILHQAETNKPDNLDIESLVKNYRESLLKNSYEQVLMENELDSTITQAELTAFYEKNKEQYELETPILRCHFYKIPLPVRQEDSIRIWWNGPTQRNIAQLKAYADSAGGSFILNDSLWNRLEELSIELPKGTLTTDNVASKKDFQQKDDSYQYLLRVYEVRNRKEIAPLSFIEEQARKVILHFRKIKLLQEKKEALYDLELRRKNIEIFQE
ncbi:MAG: hypothetical protein AAF242_03555 [Bacteroidota bacterium]